MTDRLESLHAIGYCHGDLKPQNILCTNQKNNNSLYLIDYGLAQNFAINQEKKLEFKGTPFFASNNQLVRGKLGPKDDLESLIYVLIYLT
jgi:serine/threonine protein kinase